MASPRPSRTVSPSTNPPVRGVPPGALSLLKLLHAQAGGDRPHAFFNRGWCSPRISESIRGVKFGFFTDPDRTRYCYLRLRRLKKAIEEAEALDAIATELEVPAVAPGSSPRIKMAAIDRQIDRLRATASSIWHQAPAPDVLAASLFAASKRTGGRLAELFSPMPEAAALKRPVSTWLDSAGLTLFDRLPSGIAFDLVGYHKAAFSGLRVVAVGINNDASRIDDALEAMKPFARYTQAIDLALTPAVAADYLTATAKATGRWDGDALARRLQTVGVGLLMVEGDAVSQPVLPKTRAIDAESLTALMAAFGARA
jgi:hypothetical protein